MKLTTRILLWALCTLTLPILSIAMLIQMTVGSEKRGQSMAVAIDSCGNALFGGPPTQTISTRTGNCWLQNRGWAKVAAPAIDALFGVGHCLSNVDLPAIDLTNEQKTLVNKACADQGIPPTYVITT